MKTALRFLVPVLFILSLQFYPKIVISSTQNSHYVMHNCEKSNETYTIGSTFQTMLNDTLFSVLPAKALKTAFGNSTNGTGVDQVNSLFYCRGDVDHQGCHECVVAAADKASKRCQFMKEAVVWFEDCTLRYSNRSIFSIDEESPVYIYTNKSGIVNDDLLNHLDDEFARAMDELIKQAASFRNLQSFATTQLNVSSTKVLQCAVQCSPDISGVPCEGCLKSAVRQRDKWADTMIFMPSCFIRIDLFNSTPPPPPKSISKRRHGLSTIVIVAIALASSVVIVIISVAGFCWFCHYPGLKGLKGLKKFTFKQLQTATNNFSKENFLGKGGFGYVYKGTVPFERNVTYKGRKKEIVQRPKREVAVKKLKEGTYHRKHEFLSELNNNSYANHKNVVSVIGYCSQREHRMLVYELAANNSLYTHLHGRNHDQDYDDTISTSDDAGPGMLVWEKRMAIAIGTAYGLKYLHNECKPTIIHRDIKSSNILLDSNYVPMLADFGLAKAVFPDDNTSGSTEVRGTMDYLDPEYANEKKLTVKSDVYSFGIVLLELLKGQKPREFDEKVASLSLLRALPEPLSDCQNHSTCDGQNEPTSEITEDVSSKEGPKYFQLTRLVDPNLEANYDVEEMARVIICAAMCVHSSSDFRLCMSQVVQLLEGGSLPANNKDVAHMIECTKCSNEPESSSSNTYPDRLGLTELKRLAIRVLLHKPSDSGGA